jgi:hypothetical protein
MLKGVRLRSLNEIRRRRHPKQGPGQPPVIGLILPLLMAGANEGEEIVDRKLQAEDAVDLIHQNKQPGIGEMAENFVNQQLQLLHRRQGFPGLPVGLDIHFAQQAQIPQQLQHDAAIPLLMADFLAAQLGHVEIDTAMAQVSPAAAVPWVRRLDLPIWRALKT